jgi:chemotaxis protein MotB|tara:strand:- start:1015 stop:1833 length:819 start_codon:yes stop_codon:yes gene_type:complete
LPKIINEDDCPEGLPGWLATFGDLMSLLLTFFVLLLSFSSMEEIKFQQAMGSLRGSLGVFDSKPELSQPLRVLMPVVRGSIAQSQNIRKSAEELEKTLSDEGVEGDISLEGTGSGLVIRIQAPVLYDVGRAALKPTIQNALNKIGDMLLLLPNEIVVQGHTDNKPIVRTDGSFPSNWELSFQRAVNVVRYLITETNVHGRRISAEGYGEYRPLVPNTTDENRAKNRRVEIHILYAGEVDGNLEIIAKTFEQASVQGKRIGGGSILKKRSWER